MSFTPSKQVESSQVSVYDKLEEIVKRHLQHKHNAPISKHNEEAFLEAHQFWQIHNQPATILDSACGMADSTRQLALSHPEHLVIGIDQSEKRLSNSNNRALPGNCLLLRAECTDFWRLAEQQHWTFDEHFLLYPNPWPKPQHFMRRWHGHPAFSSLLKISKKIELRTNWKIYAEEFYQALSFTKVYESSLDKFTPTTTISAFEKKFVESQHELWQVKVRV